MFRYITEPNFLYNRQIASFAIIRGRSDKYLASPPDGAIIAREI